MGTSGILECKIVSKKGHAPPQQLIDQMAVLGLLDRLDSGLACDAISVVAEFMVSVGNALVTSSVWWQSSWLV